MTISQVLKDATKRLREHNIPSPSLDAEVLLSWVLKKDRAWLYANNDYALSFLKQHKFFRAITQRSHRVPLAYIIGAKPFFHSDLIVNKHTLIPRSETELMVEEAIRSLLTQQNPCTVIDIGTGSGAIIISVVKELRAQQKDISSWKFFATDISKNALWVAKRNAKKHGASDYITFLHGNLLKPLFFSKDVRHPLGCRTSATLGKKQPARHTTKNLYILANLPYLSEKQMHTLQPEITFEPQQALASGTDGLDHYRELVSHIQKMSVSDTLVHCFFEIDPAQENKISAMVQESFPKNTSQIFTDLSENSRIFQLIL